jgi:hypothetical protein
MGKSDFHFGLYNKAREKESDNGRSNVAANHLRLVNNYVEACDGGHAMREFIHTVACRTLDI